MVIGREQMRSGEAAVAGSSWVIPSRFTVDLAMATAGAVAFSFPMLMTMEMWWLGFSIEPSRLFLFMVVSLPLLYGLSSYWGLADDRPGFLEIVDVFFAYAVAISVSTVLLWLFAIIEPGMSREEIVGKVAVQSVLASIGAILGRNQFGARSGTGSGRKQRMGYAGLLFVMAVGAIFLSSSLASTEEMVLIAYKMTDGRAIALMAATLVFMHVFVQIAGQRGKDRISATSTWWHSFLWFTVVGYALALGVSAYALWTFGRMDDTGSIEVVRAVIVLGVPAAIGAAASHFLL